MEQVKEIMHKDPACCEPETPLNEVARLMVENDCGAIPVVGNVDECKPLLGIITDRDIVCRIVGEDKNPLDYVADDCMSEPVVYIAPEDSMEMALQLMERYQIRRIPVVDQEGVCCGLVTQAQLAKKMDPEKAGELIKNVSEHTEKPSRVPSTAY